MASSAFATAVEHAPTPVYDPLITPHESDVQLWEIEYMNARLLGDEQKAERLRIRISKARGWET